MRVFSQICLAVILTMIFGACDDGEASTKANASDAGSEEDAGGAADSGPEPGDASAPDTRDQDDATADSSSDDTSEQDTHTSDVGEDSTMAADTADIGDDVAQPVGPLCTFPAETLIFAPAAVGVPASTSAFSFGTVSVTNCSDSTVTLTRVALSSDTDPAIAIDFTPFTSDTLELEPNGTLKVELRFSPEAVRDTYTGALDVTFDSGDSVSVNLRGAGVEDTGGCMLSVGATLLTDGDASMTAMEVEPVAVGGDFNDNFLLANVGRAPCEVTAITLDAPSGAFSFPFESQISTPTTLSFRQLRVINLQHAPTSAGTDTATLTVVSDDAQNPTQTMHISGLGY